MEARAVKSRLEVIRQLVGSRVWFMMRPAGGRFIGMWANAQEARSERSPTENAIGAILA